jgi:hypothetical protein
LCWTRSISAIAASAAATRARSSSACYEGSSGISNMRITAACCAGSSRVQAWSIIQKYMIARNTPQGDQATVNGYRGMFGDFNLFVSNNLPFFWRLDLGSTNPTDGDDHQERIVPLQGHLGGERRHQDRRDRGRHGR